MKGQDEKMNLTRMLKNRLLGYNDKEPKTYELENDVKSNDGNEEEN